ncbi:MAG TPA: tetratricopeptide repeat protein [Terriglobia bacterium]|nr:tetratricopeptide repeat protein [Terriglobia bacterium]
MRFPKRIFLTLSFGLIAGALAYASPGALGSQDAKPEQSTPPATGQQGGTTQQAKPGQGGQAAGQAPSAPTVTPEERQAYQAVASEAAAGLDPDKVVSLSEDYIKKYANSPMLTSVYAFEATAFRQKGELDKVVDASEKSLKLNGDNLVSLITLALILPQPQLMQGNELDKQKKLTEAETDANHALEIIAKIQKQPTETDDQFKKRQGELSSEPHAALGMIHLQRSTMVSLSGGMDPEELSKSAQEYQQAVTVTDRPQPEDYFRLGEVYENQNKIDDAIAAFSKASEIGQGSGIQPYADKQIEILKKKQAEAKPPAKP